MYCKCSKILNTFLILFPNKISVMRSAFLKMLVRIVNREDPAQKQSDPSLPCLSRPFGQGSSIQNFRTRKLRH